MCHLDVRAEEIFPGDEGSNAFFCLPIRRRKINAAAPDSNLTYTLEDRVAQAYAYGLSYGKFMAILHDGGKLPPQLRPIVWPAGSEHAGK